jgi:hypothetical protein
LQSATPHDEYSRDFVDPGDSGPNDDIGEHRHEDMERRELRKQKWQPKFLADRPVFSPLEKGMLPKPFAKMGGPRIASTGLIDVSPSHQVFFLWKNGPILSDRSFYGWLLKKLQYANLYPLVEMHWHPSHKGLHIKTPCDSNRDYTNRQLPGAMEMGLRSNTMYDPKEITDRLHLIERFCRIAGIHFIPEDSLLWE